MRIIRIDLSEKDMDAIEDVFFYELSEKKYKRLRPRLLKIWKRLCEEMER